MNKFGVASLLALAFTAPALSQTKADDHVGHRATVVAAPPVADMTEGEVRKVDKNAGTITLKHGEIRNIGMPPMTMVFRAKNASMLDRVKAGDKVRFTAEKTAAGVIIVTDVQLATQRP